MTGVREIIEFRTTFGGLSKFIEDNKSLFVFEMVSTLEYMLYNNIDVATICTICIYNDVVRTKLDCNITIEDAIKDINKLLKWAVDIEEYELAHRIKLITQYLEKNESRSTSNR